MAGSLDRDLPGIHGDTLCQLITAQDNRAMVLMLTAAGLPGDRVAGLSLGADDYLTKPFHFPELRASPGFLSAEDLLEQVWDENADPFTNTVTVTIGRLRRKLGQPPAIVTTPGLGYRVASETGPG